MTPLLMYHQKTFLIMIPILTETFSVLIKAAYIYMHMKLEVTNVHCNTRQLFQLDSAESVNIDIQ